MPIVGKEMYEYARLSSGSPDAILNLASFIDEDECRETVAQLGQDGYRIIAMRIQGIAENSSLFDQVYPPGVRNNTSIHDEWGCG